MAGEWLGVRVDQRCRDSTKRGIDGTMVILNYKTCWYCIITREGDLVLRIKTKGFEAVNTSSTKSRWGVAKTCRLNREHAIGIINQVIVIAHLSLLTHLSATSTTASYTTLSTRLTLVRALAVGAVWVIFLVGASGSNTVNVKKIRFNINRARVETVINTSVLAYATLLSNNRGIWLVAHTTLKRSIDIIVTGTDRLFNGDLTFAFVII
jgi:hypothetical protein